MGDRQKVLVVGIDGGTYTVIDPLIEQRRLPNLAEIRANGSEAVLRSVIPPHSAPAWTTFMTGWNPGRHGVLDFWERDLSAYDARRTGLITSHSFAGRAFWDIAGSMGWRVGLITVPVTYPAWPVNGFMLSGYLLSPGTDQSSSYPDDLSDRFGEQLVFPEAYRRGAGLDAVAREGPEMILRRGRVAAVLQREFDCDLLVVVLAPTDKAQHDFWRYHERDSSLPHLDRYSDVVNQHYEACDCVLGELWDQMGRSNTDVVVVSDHGAGTYARRSFQTNSALLNHGLLSVRGKRVQRPLVDRVPGLRPAMRGGVNYHLKRWGRRLMPSPVWNTLRAHYRGVAAIDWSRTQCYRVQLQTPAEGIMINVAGRQPHGVVEPGQEYGEVQSRVVEAMTQATDPDTGEHIVEACYRREDAYEGPLLHRMPDVVLVLRPGYKGDWRLDAGLVTATPKRLLERFQGQHLMDGLIMAAGPAFRQGALLHGASLLDMAPTLLYLMGVPIPDDMDGRVLKGAFRERVAESVPRRRPRQAPQGEASSVTYSAEQEREIMDRLAGLGYVE